MPLRDLYVFQLYMQMPYRPEIDIVGVTYIDADGVEREWPIT